MSCDCADRPDSAQLLRNGRPWRDKGITDIALLQSMSGINASLELIRRTRGGAWPGEPVTHEGNYVDLVWHEAEWRDSSSFTYVLTAAGQGYIGCLYLYPLGRRSPLTEELLRRDVDISWWVTPTAYAAGLYRRTHQAVVLGGVP